MFVASNADASASVHQDNKHAREELGKALGRLASGVFVVTVDTETGPHGMLATWIAQAAFEPPMVTIAINSERPILKDIEGKVISINILSSQNMDVFKAFARPSKGEHDDRFDNLDTTVNPDGATAFAGVVAVLNCVVSQSVPAGDHVVVLATVRSGKTIKSDAEPMTHLRKNGFQY
jgi:flavin reductase (DIM6/NTAB) family NADH-FMN oxidoreductase RutF